MKRSYYGSQMDVESQASQKRRRTRGEFTPNAPATKKWVNKQVNKAKWSKQMVSVTDFDEPVGSVNKYTLTRSIVEQLLASDNALFNQGTQEIDSEGNVIASLKIKIDAIKWQLRYALGENETTDAVSQNIREIFCRVDDQFQVAVDPGNLPNVVEDQDGSVRYHELYGNVMGLYSDRFMYLESQAADSDTTAGGQKMSKGYQRLRYVDTLSHSIDSFVESGVSSEKGQLALEVFADDPSGVNAKIYGFVEIHWRFLKT